MIEDDATSEEHDAHLEEISDYLLDQTIPKATVTFRSGDFHFWVDVVHRGKFERELESDRKTVAMFSFSEAIINGLDQHTLCDGSSTPTATEDEISGWLSVAEILEIEARRIRNTMGRAKSPGITITLDPQ